MSNVIFEACVDSIDSALNAELGGARRIELCDNLPEGGTTPSAGCIKQVIDNLSIDINVLIRPRGGDFLYSDSEFEIIKQDIQYVKNMGIHGVVIGVLRQDGNIDIPKMKQLVDLARPLSITFHRAIDMTPEPFRSLEEIIDLGIDRILTSGQAKTAWRGRELIAQLVKKANDRIIIMAGSGINESNIRKLVDITGIRECHATARSKVTSKMRYPGNNQKAELQSQLFDYDRMVTDATKIRNMLSGLELI